MLPMSNVNNYSTIHYKYPSLQFPFRYGYPSADGGLISVFFGEEWAQHLFLSSVFLTDFNKVPYRINSRRSPPCESDKPTKKEAFVNSNY